MLCLTVSCCDLEIIFNKRPQIFIFQWVPKTCGLYCVGDTMTPVPETNQPGLIQDSPTPHFYIPSHADHAEGFTSSTSSACFACLLPFFKELIFTCPLIIFKIHLYQRYWLMPQSDTDASSWSSTHIPVPMPVMLSLNNYLVSLLPNDCEPLDVWFYFLFISSS